MGLISLGQLFSMMGFSSPGIFLGWLHHPLGPTWEAAAASAIFGQLMSKEREQKESHWSLKGQDCKYAHHICSCSIGHKTRSHLDAGGLRHIVFLFAQERIKMVYHTVCAWQHCCPNQTVAGKQPPGGLSQSFFINWCFKGWFWCTVSSLQLFTYDIWKWNLWKLRNICIPLRFTSASQLLQRVSEIVMWWCLAQSRHWPPVLRVWHQTSLFGITLELVRNTNSWVSSQIHWIRNSEDGADNLF